jgi:hypothetical protein
VGISVFGNPGIICLPTAITDPPEDWEQINCPKCGEVCYLPPIAKDIGLTKTDLKGGLCIKCAIDQVLKEKKY